MIVDDSDGARTKEKLRCLLQSRKRKEEDKDEV